MDMISYLPPVNGYLSGTCYNLHLTTDILTDGGNSFNEDNSKYFMC